MSINAHRSIVAMYCIIGGEHSTWALFSSCIWLQALCPVVEDLQSQVESGDTYRKDAEALLDNYK